MLLTTTALTALLLTSPIDGNCSSTLASATAPAEKSIVETALAAEDFSTLVAALKAANLVEALQGDGPFTVFAPTNAAFAKLPADQLANLLKPENKGLLTAILTYHVVPGHLPASDVLKRDNAMTLNGQRIAFAKTDGGVTVQDATVTQTDITCSNGTIHVIDSIILPNTKDIVETAVAAGSFKTLAAALGAAQLVEALQSEGPFTVFAPTDEAFAKLPAGTVESLLKPENREKLAAILKLHVVSGRVYSEAVAAGSAFETLNGQELTTRMEGERVMVGAARVVKADIETTNGVIHVIDSVLLPQ